MDLLAQSKLDTTDATTLLNQSAKVQMVIVCNGTASEVTYRIFHPVTQAEDYAQDNALFYDAALGANNTDIHTFTFDLSLNALRLGAQAGTENALTISVYGEAL